MLFLFLARNQPASNTQSVGQQQQQQQFLISPITGERVPADKLEDHMKHG